MNLYRVELDSRRVVPFLWLHVFSVISIAGGQLWTENIKWKIPEIRKSLALSCLPFKVTGSHLVVLLCKGPPFLQWIQAVYPISQQRHKRSEEYGSAVTPNWKKSGVGN